MPSRIVQTPAWFFHSTSIPLRRPRARIVDSETTQGTICIDGPPPTGGLTRVATQTVAHGQAGHVVLVAPWTGRYVINGACVPGDGLFELFVN